MIAPLYKAAPFKSTAEKLFFNDSAYDEVAKVWDEEGCSQQLNILLPSEETGLLKNIRFESNALFGASETGDGSVSTELTVADRSLSISVTYGKQELSISGLGDQDILIPLDNLEEELKNSVLAPDSGSDFALSDEDFTDLVEMARELTSDGFDAHLSDSEKKELKKAFKRIISRTKKHVDVKSDLSLKEDGFGFVRYVEYVIEKEDFASFLRATAEESESNSVLRELIDSVFYTPSDKKSGTPSSETVLLSVYLNDGEGSESSTLFGKDALLAMAEDFEKAFKEFEISFSYVTDGKRICEFDLSLNTETKKGDYFNISTENDLSFSGITASLVSATDFECSSDSEIYEGEITLEYTKKTENDTVDTELDITLEDTSDFGKEATAYANLIYDKITGEFELYAGSDISSSDLMFRGICFLDSEQHMLEIEINKTKQASTLIFDTRLLSLSVKKIENEQIPTASGVPLLSMNESELLDAVKSLPFYTVENMLYDLTGTTLGFSYTKDEKILFDAEGVLEAANGYLEKYAEYLKDPETDKNNSQIRSIYVYDSDYKVYVLLYYSKGYRAEIYANLPDTAKNYHPARVDENGRLVVHDLEYVSETENTCNNRGEVKYVCKDCSKKIVIPKEQIEHEYTTESFKSIYDSGEEIDVTLLYCKNCREEYKVYTDHYTATLIRLEDSSYSLTDYEFSDYNEIYMGLPDEISDYITVSEIALHGNFSATPHSLRVPSGVKTIRYNQYSGLKTNRYFQVLVLPSSLVKIEDGALFKSYELQTIFFCGTEEEWNKVQLGEYREFWKNVNIVFCENGVSGSDVRDNLIPYVDEQKYLAESKEFAKTPQSTTDASTRLDLRVLHSGKVINAAYDKTSDRVAICGEYRGAVTEIFVYELSSGTLLHSFEIEDNIHKVDINENYVVLASKLTKNLHIYSMSDGKLTSVQIKRANERNPIEGDHIAHAFIDSDKVFMITGSTAKYEVLICYDIENGEFFQMESVYGPTVLLINKEKHRMVYISSTSSNTAYFIDTENAAVISSYNLVNKPKRREWESREIYIITPDEKILNLDGVQQQLPEDTTVSIPCESGRKISSHIKRSPSGGAAVYVMPDGTVGVEIKNSDGKTLTLDGIYAESAFFTLSGDVILYACDCYGLYVAQMN